MKQNIYSYLEIRSAFQKLKFFRPDLDLELIHGGSKVYKTIDDVPLRIFFQKGSFLFLQHHEKGKKTTVQDRWRSIQSGRDEAFIFLPENGGYLRLLLKRERNYNLDKYPNTYKDTSVSPFVNHVITY